MTVNLRKGVEWADGEAFTCDDVKFTMETLRDTDTAGGQHGYFMKWLESVECVDDFTVQDHLTGANPRFYQHIMVGWENHFVIVPEHIFCRRGHCHVYQPRPGQGLADGQRPLQGRSWSPRSRSSTIAATTGGAPRSALWNCPRRSGSSPPTRPATKPTPSST